MSARRDRISRRQLLRVGAVTAVGVGLSGVNARQVAASPLPDATGATHGLTAPGQVTAVSGGRLDVLAFRTMARFSVPIVGFGDVTPRIGDFVTVTNRVPGHALVALPLCRWITGAPKPLTEQIVDIGGTFVLSSSAIRSVSERGETVQVCLMDSALRSRQVLGLRAVT